MYWRIILRKEREENAVLFAHSPEGFQPLVWQIEYQRKEARQLA